jgi:putative aldouronate transport system permease protein
MDYGYSSAVGLFNSIIGVILLVIANGVARKYSETSLF